MLSYARIATAFVVNQMCKKWPTLNASLSSTTLLLSQHTTSFTPSNARSITTFQNLPEEVRQKMIKYGCPICRNNIKHFGYKDVLFLKQFISKEGRIYGKRKTGLCAKQHRKVLKAIKRSRAEGLLPNYQAPEVEQTIVQDTK